MLEPASYARCARFEAAPTARLAMFRPALTARLTMPRAAPTPRCTEALTLLTTLRPAFIAECAKLLMPALALLMVFDAKLLIELVALETVLLTELIALETWLETKWPIEPRPHLCGLWPSLLRVVKVETALKIWLCPREAR